MIISMIIVTMTMIMAMTMTMTARGPSAMESTSAVTTTMGRLQQPDPIRILKFGAAALAGPLRLWA